MPSFFSTPRVRRPRLLSSFFCLPQRERRRRRVIVLFCLLYGPCWASPGPGGPLRRSRACVGPHARDPGAARQAVLTSEGSGRRWGQVVARVGQGAERLTSCSRNGCMSKHLRRGDLDSSDRGQGELRAATAASDRASRGGGQPCGPGWSKRTGHSRTK